MRLFNTITHSLFFLFTSSILLSQTTVKEKDFTVNYSANKIGIQFDDTHTAADIKAFDAFTNSEVWIDKDSTALNGFALNNLFPAQILKIQYGSTGTNAKTTITYLASQSLSSGVMNVYFNNPVNTSYAQTQNAVNLSNTLDDKLIEYINGCASTLDIAIYNSYSPSETSGIAGAINAAHARGVQVRIIYDGSTSSLMIPLLHQAISTLGSPQGGSYAIMHNKFVIFDANNADPNRPWVWTGSTNWTELQIEGPDQNNAIAIQDQSLALAYKLEFDEMWGSSTLTPNLAQSKFGPYKTDNTPHTFIIGGKTVESYFSPSDDTNTHIISTINTANSDIDIATMLITRSDITAALLDKFNSGMTNINLVTDTQNPTGNQFLAIKAGLSPNHAIKSSFSGVMHHKFMVVDNFAPTSDPLVLLGSHNWSSSAQTKNDENTLIVHDANIANQYYQSFAYLYLQAGGVISNSLSVNDSIWASNWSVYPNPSKGIFHIQNHSATALENTSLNIIDILGRTIHSGTYHAGETIDLSSNTNGLYFIQLQTPTQSTNFKILKQ
ncbi:MAG TPA: phospholipase D-like domain-containing protein, partial [Flavobacterium sp.]|nr:phospholipase D-like domain-containing protein [Flavobacterium sp.]